MGICKNTLASFVKAELLRLTIVSMAAGVVLINQSLSGGPNAINSFFNYNGKGFGGSDEIVEQGISDTINYYIGFASTKGYAGFENPAIIPDSEASSDANQTEDPNEDTLIIINNGSLISTSGFLDIGMGRKETITYEIKQGDTPSSIAELFNISTNTLLWANNLDLSSATRIKPGDKLVILPISGIRYTIKKNDTIAAIAKKYSASEEKMLSFNNLNASDILETDSVIVIPDGKMPILPSLAKPIRPKTSLAYIQPAKSGASGVYRFISTGEFNTPNDEAGDIAPASQGRRFIWGQCTYYVALRRYIPWSGDAKNWIRNAKSYGYKTGKIPKAGAIVVTSENPRYWHVAYIEAVSDGKMTISEMNYVGIGIKSVRVLSFNNPVIKGYIYEKE